MENSGGEVSCKVARLNLRPAIGREMIAKLPLHPRKFLIWWEGHRFYPWKILSWKLKTVSFLVTQAEPQAASYAPVQDSGIKARAALDVAGEECTGVARVISWGEAREFGMSLLRRSS